MSYALDAQSARRTEAAVRGHERASRRGEGRAGPTPPPRRTGDYSVWGKITGAARDGSNWRWTYQFAEAYKAGKGLAAGWATTPGGATGEAYNGAEAANGATGLLGNGVTTANLDGTAIQPQPVPAGVVVRLTWTPFGLAGEGEWWFTTMNGLDGKCS